MGKLSTAVLAVLAAALAASASAQTPPLPAQGSEAGFFRPSRDPALTAIRPPLAQPNARIPAEPATVVVVDMAEEVREAEEEQMDRVEAAAERARAKPVITSPLDGTAPIMSPLDGSAPIVSPVGR